MCCARCVNSDACHAVVAVAAEIGRIDKLAARRVELGNKSIGKTAAVERLYWGDLWHVGRRRDTGEVCVTQRIDRDRTAKFADRSSKIRRIDKL